MLVFKYYYYNLDYNNNSIMADDINPLKILPIIYGFIDKSVFEIILHTCRRTDIPPKLKKNVVMVSFILIDMYVSEVISFIPAVVSSIPRKMYSKNLLLKKIIDIIFDSCSIEIINENNRINPQTILNV